MFLGVGLLKNCCLIRMDSRIIGGWVHFLLGEGRIIADLAYLEFAEPNIYIVHLNSMFYFQVLFHYVEVTSSSPFCAELVSLKLE